MNGWNISNKYILIYRVFFAGLSWFTIITNLFISTISSGDPLAFLLSFRYYTMQKNLIVSIWLTLAIVWYNKPESLEKIMGSLKGAFPLYITTTFIFFAIFLQIFYHPTGWAAFSNIILHYLMLIAFIGDWVLTENKLRYKWNYIAYWIIYPLCYLVFALIHGILTSDYLYLFLDISRLGLLGYILIIFILVGVGIGLACGYIAINRYRTRK